MNKLFQNRLRQLRRDKDLSQSDLAEKVNVEPNTISRYERGERIPPANVLSSIADALSCTTDYLLGRSEEPNLVNYDTGVDYEGDRVFIEIDKEYLGDGLSKEEIDEFIQMGLAWRKARLAREAKEKNKKPSID